MNDFGFVLVQDELLGFPECQNIFKLLLKHVFLSSLRRNIQYGSLVLLGIEINEALKCKLFIFDVEFFSNDVLFDSDPMRFA